MKKLLKIVNGHSIGITFSKEEQYIYNLEEGKTIEIEIK
jgi:hypothetical protein